jgi:hypothetical protein
MRHPDRLASLTSPIVLTMMTALGVLVARPVQAQARAVQTIAAPTQGVEGVEVVSGEPNPVIRYSVGHQHFASGCGGYLYFSKDAIWYEVVSPAKDKGHGFRRKRSELEVAKRWSLLGSVAQGVELKFRGGVIYHFWRVKESALDPSVKTDGDPRLPHTDLLQVATTFDEAFAAAKVHDALRKAAVPAALVQPLTDQVRITTNPQVVRGCTLVGDVNDAGQWNAGLRQGSTTAAEERAIQEVKKRAATMEADTVLLVASTTEDSGSPLRGEGYRCSPANRGR